MSDDLKKSKILDTLNNDANFDPNENYSTFIKTIMDLKDKHIPKKWVKFNKKKHTKNEWATSALLKSINVKNKMYKKLQQTSIHDEYFKTAKQNNLGGQHF